MGCSAVLDTLILYVAECVRYSVSLRYVTRQREQKGRVLRHCKEDLPLLL
jgi:hypothetical protein